MRHPIGLVSLVIGVAHATSASPFSPGAVCAGVTNATAAEDMLRGKHIVTQDMGWAPYAVKNPDSPKGWTGLNIELFGRVCQILGCTFEVRDMGYPLEGETVRVRGYVWVLSPYGHK